jgi:predicted 3-demethylubiquinone-9 3-methyltransferase (glyoxalase superfamily)
MMLPAPNPAAMEKLILTNKKSMDAMMKMKKIIIKDIQNAK